MRFSGKGPKSSPGSPGHTHSLLRHLATPMSGHYSVYTSHAVGISECTSSQVYSIPEPGPPSSGNDAIKNNIYIYNANVIIDILF